MKLKPYNSVDKNLWALSRYGLTPDKIWQRLIHRSGPKILSISIPKSGTHLLERILCLHPRLYRDWMPTIHDGNVNERGGLGQLLTHLGPGEILLVHLVYSQVRLEMVRSAGVRPLFLIRDPRDVAISQAFYIAHKTDHPLYDPDFEVRFRHIIEGVKDRSGRGRAPLKNRLERFAGWLESDCLILRFEDIVGQQGGGDAAKQLETLRAIFDFIQVEASDDWIRRICDQLFSESSPTFRRGAIGQWKEHFTPEMKTAFKRAAGDILIRYGYERDDNW